MSETDRTPGRDERSASASDSEAAKQAVIEVYLQQALGAAQPPNLTEQIVAAARDEGLALRGGDASPSSEQTHAVTSHAANSPASTGSTDHPVVKRKTGMSNEEQRRSKQGSAKSNPGSGERASHAGSAKSRQGSQKSKQGSQQSKQGSPKSKQGSQQSKQGSQKSKQGSPKSPSGEAAAARRSTEHGARKSKQGSAKSKQDHHGARGSATRENRSGARSQESYAARASSSSGKPAAKQGGPLRQNLLLVGSALGVLAIALTLALVIAAMQGEGDPDTVATEENQPVEEEVPQEVPEPEPEPEVVELEPLEFVEHDGPLLAETGVDFEVALEVSGGEAPYRWQVSRTTPAPRGLELSEEGVLAGSPRFPGDYEFEVYCTDANGERISKHVEMQIDERLEIFFLGDPPDPILGESYEFRLLADGGAPPYEWELLETSSLPAGLTFDRENGALTGVPEELRRFRFAVRLTDSVGRVDEREMLIEVLDVSRGGMTGLAPEPPPIEELPETDWDEIVVPEPVGEEATGFTPPGRDEMERLREYNREAADLMRSGEYREAAALLGRALDIYPYDYVTLYNLACAYAQLGEKSSAIDKLRRAIEAGFSDFNHIRADADLDPIRDEPDYIALIEDPEQLQRAAATSRVQAMRDEFPGYLVVADHDNRFIMATNQSRAVLEMLVERIENFSAVIWRELDWYRPDHYIEIVLPSLEDFRGIASRRGAPPGVAGWYSPQERRLVNRTIGHVLTHEFLHALHFADLAHRGQHQHIWFIEGLATLFEDSRLPQSPDDTIEPFHSNRLRAAKALQQQEDRWSWRELFKMNQREFMPNTRTALINYGTSRYICYWLWEQGKLKEYYHLYCQTYGQSGVDGRSGIVAMEMLFDKPLEEIEAEWREWLLELDDPPQQNRAWLGVHRDEEQDETGIRIGKVVSDSPADNAGMRAGDVIVEIDGRAVDNPGNLVQALSAFNPGDTVPITVVRTDQDETGRWIREPITKAVRLDDRGRRQ